MAGELTVKAERLGIVVPAARTLRRYGLTPTAWLEILAEQGWQCPICERRVENWNTDHEHVPGWAKMAPAQRRRYVRGVLCVRCNWKIVKSRMEARVAENVARYLRAYERRRDGSPPGAR